MTTINQLKNDSDKSLMERLGISHPLALPRVVKVIVSAGVGRAATDMKLLEEVSAVLSQVTGQKPALRRARKAIASFKIRQGSPVGLVVTLRGKRMKDFLARLIHVVLPRIRDFRGLSVDGFDEHGNFNLGIREQLVFPEISPEKTQTLHGLQITIVTTAKSKEDGRLLLESLGFPFRKG